MTVIEELEKASKEAAEAGVEMLRKSQMGFDFSSPATHDHHVAYTRTNAAGTASSIKAKGTAPAKSPVPKQTDEQAGAKLAEEQATLGLKHLGDPKGLINAIVAREYGKLEYTQGNGAKAPLELTVRHDSNMVTIGYKKETASRGEVMSIGGTNTMTGQTIQKQREAFDRIAPGLLGEIKNSGIRIEDSSVEGGTIFFVSDDMIPDRKPAAATPGTELIVKKPKAAKAKTDIESAHEVAKTVVAALKEHRLNQAGVYIVEYEGRKPDVEVTTGEDKYEPTREGEAFTRWWSTNARTIQKETGINIGLQSSIGMDSKGVTTVKEPRHYADHIRDTTATRTGSSRGLDAMHGRGTGNGGSGTAWR